MRSQLPPPAQGTPQPSRKNGQPQKPTKTSRRTGGNPGKHHQAWMTPPEIIDAVAEAIGGITLDPCSPGAGKSYVEAAIHYVEDPTDPLGGGLAARWVGESGWLNCPYDKPLPWTAKALASVQSGDVRIIVGLLPVRTDGRWYRETIAGHAHLLLLPKRVKFHVEVGVPGEHSADFSCILVIWGGSSKQVADLRAAFPAADFRPAPHHWQPQAQPLPHGLGTARTRLANAVRMTRGGARRRLNGEGR